MGFLVTFCRNGIFVSLWHLIWALGVFFVFLPIWLIKAVGAGDVKLLMTAALFLGKDMLSFLLCAGICTGLHAFALMIIRKNYYARMNLFFRHMITCVNERRLIPYPFERGRDSKEGGIKLSYGLLAGHILAVGMGLYQM